MGLSRLASGSAFTVTDENFNGFVALTDTLVTHIAYGHGNFTPESPNAYVYPASVNIDDILVKAGANVPVKFSSIKFDGSLALLKDK